MGTNGKKIYVWLTVLVLLSFAATIYAAQQNAGLETFQGNCSGCHPNGGNAIKPSKPIKGSKKLANEGAFLNWLRKPIAPMPTFSSEKISDEQAKLLYNYLKNAWK